MIRGIIKDILTPKGKKVKKVKKAKKGKK